MSIDRVAKNGGLRQRPGTPVVVSFARIESSRMPHSNKVLIGFDALILPLLSGQ
jgi:hypothetical protein